MRSLISGLLSLVGSLLSLAGWLALAGSILLVAAPGARADTRTYVIAIGNNAPPSSDGGGEALSPLRYADDDAAAFFTFTRDLAEQATLLTVLDADSQVRFPELAQVARPPSLVELKRVVAQHKTRFEEDLRAGHEPVLLFFYSGHGSRAAGRPPSLALIDAPLTQAVLYDEILAALPARYVHLVVDACHAEAVVRPRDLQAQAVDVTDADVSEYAARATLARFPHVGVVVATASEAQAQEWDVYQRGVFTHEVLSGLRGAADVNGDGRVEYSELYAFLAAANREVSDPRAKLSVVARPPGMNRRAPLVDLRALRAGASVSGLVATLGRFHIEDARGNRLADVRAEPGFRVTLAMPSEQTLFLRTASGEAELHLRRGSRTALDQIALHAAPTAPRGSMDASMRRGLFATPFGPLYYRGFVDRHDEVLAIPASEPTTTTAAFPVEPAPTIAAQPAAGPSRVPAYIAFGAAGALAVAAAAFAGLTESARQDYASAYEREAPAIADRFALDRDLTIGFAAGAAVAAGVGAVLLYRAAHTRAVTPPATTSTPAARFAIPF